MIRKIRLFSKFMTSQPGKQTIAIQVLPNISRDIPDRNCLKKSLHWLSKQWNKKTSKPLCEKTQKLNWLSCKTRKVFFMFFVLLIHRRLKWQSYTYNISTITHLNTCERTAGRKTITRLCFSYAEAWWRNKTCKY